MAMALAMLLGACGGDKPEALLASAKDYLAKNDAKAAVIQIKNALQKDPALAEARFLLGKALLASGDATGAEVELRKALDAKYPADQAVPLLAQALLRSGQAKKLLSDLTAAELTTPEAKADFQTSVGLAQASLGQMDKGRASIAAALALKPDYAPALIAKIRLALANQDFVEALAVAESILAKAPTNPEAWKLKGDILWVQGNGEGALAAYRKATEVRPDFRPGHVALLEALLQQGKLDEAGTELEAMKKVLPKNPQTLMGEGIYLFMKKDFAKARDVVQELLKIAPNNPKALLLAGAIQVQLNSPTQAEDFLTRAVTLAPEGLAQRRMLAMVYLRLGQPARALAAVEPALANADKNASLAALFGQIYLQNGDPQKAEEYFKKSAVLDPKDPKKQTAIALTHLAAGQVDSAFGDLEQIASTDAGTSADMALIASALQRKDFAKALMAIDGLEKKQPDNPLVHTLRGTALVAKGDEAGGRTSFAKALSLNAAYLPAATSLAGLDLKANKPEEAKKRFESVLAADPKNVQAMLGLADLKARTGAKPDEVVAQLDAAVRANPGEPAARMALISFYLGNKDPTKAISAAQDAVAAIPNEPRILDGLGQAQQAAGDSNQALATYGKMAALLPNSPEVYLRMAEIHAAAKNRDAAMQALRKALQIKPDLLPAQQGLIVLNMEAGNVAEAETVVREVKKQRPTEAIGYLLEGDVAAKRKAWPVAIAAYKDGLKHTPDSQLAVKLDMALKAGGNDVEADKFAASWLAQHPSDALFRLHLAETATARKDFATAGRHYQTLLQQQPDNPLLLNNAAWVLGQLKDPKAIELAEKANRLAPNQPGILDTLGALLAEKGDLVRAQELLQKALDLAPQAAEVRLNLARVQIKAGNKADARKNLDVLAKLGDGFPAQAEVTRLALELGK